jgi:hypothetical protein
VDVETFWTLIDEARVAADGEDPFEQSEDQARILTEHLAALPPEQIVAYQGHLDDALRASYRWDLWAAAYVINGGCSDDGFEYFRAWLIGQGRAAFQAALADPDSLADVVDDEVEAEDLLYVAWHAYQEATGEELETPPREPYDEAGMGEPWEEDDLPDRVPRLCEKFWD